MVQINGKRVWMKEFPDRYCLFLVKEDGTKLKVTDPRYDKNFLVDQGKTMDDIIILMCFVTVPLWIMVILLFYILQEITK